MNLGKSWDKVADKFNTYNQDVWYGAADNINTVRPVMIDFIKEKFPKPKGLKALDYGCGTGMFCRELKSFGFETSGIDLSAEMIKIGQKNLDASIHLSIGDTSTAKRLSVNSGPFNLISAIMVLQFTKKENLANLVSSLKLNGYLIFANHNPKGLKARGVKDTFTLSDTNVSLPIYPRDIKTYDALLGKLGLKRVLKKYPSASKKFLQKHHITRPTDIPKYTLLAYQKYLNKPATI